MPLEGSQKIELVLDKGKGRRNLDPPEAPAKPAVVSLQPACVGGDGKTFYLATRALPPFGPGSSRRFARRVPYRVPSLW